MDKTQAERFRKQAEVAAKIDILQRTAINKLIQEGVEIKCVHDEIIVDVKDYGRVRKALDDATKKGLDV